MFSEHNYSVRQKCQFQQVHETFTEFAQHKCIRKIKAKPVATNFDSADCSESRNTGSIVKSLESTEIEPEGEHPVFAS